MSLNFPLKTEVRLESPPLSEVVCQVRFPAILRIIKEDPVDFQERIRERFPELRVEHGFSVRLPGPGSREEPAAEAGARIHRFHTPDELTVVSLAVDFYALSTRRYRHWDDFARDLDLVDQAAQSVYRPAYAARVGLRFINRFTCANSDAQSFDELVNMFHPDLTTLLRSEAWTSPAEMLSQLVLTDDGGKLAIRHGIGEEGGERFFLLDFDYFEEGQHPLGGLLERLERYHQVIHDAFRWGVPDPLLARLGPVLPKAA